MFPTRSFDCRTRCLIIVAYNALVAAAEAAFYVPAWSSSTLPWLRSSDFLRHRPGHFWPPPWMCVLRPLARPSPWSSSSSFSLRGHLLCTCLLTSDPSRTSVVDPQPCLVPRRDRRTHRGCARRVRLSLPWLLVVATLAVLIVAFAPHLLIAGTSVEALPVDETIVAALGTFVALSPTSRSSTHSSSLAPRSHDRRRCLGRARCRFAVSASSRPSSLPCSCLPSALHRLVHPRRLYGRRARLLQTSN